MFEEHVPQNGDFPNGLFRENNCLPDAWKPGEGDGLDGIVNVEMLVERFNDVKRLLENIFRVNLNKYDIDCHYGLNFFFFLNLF
jgi:hypothetical protein